MRADSLGARAFLSHYFLSRRAQVVGELYRREGAIVEDGELVKLRRVLIGLHAVATQPEDAEEICRDLEPLLQELGFGPWRPILNRLLGNGHYADPNDI